MSAEAEIKSAVEAAIQDESVVAEVATADQDKANCLKQVEFYLSDSNLPYDKFMWSLHTKDPNHWIPISTIAGFKRMGDFKKYDAAWLADTLRTSEELLEVDDSGEMVRRTTPVLPPGVSQLENSVYAKGFPDETPGLQKELEMFFEGFAPIAGLRMRRVDKQSGGKFKNSVFCEFKTKTGANAFLNADPKPSFKDQELLIMSKESYIEMKSKEKGFAVPDKTKILVGNKPGRSFNAFKLMEEEAAGKKSGLQVKSADVEMEETKAVTVTVEGKTYDVGEDGTIDESGLEYPKNRVLKFTGAGEAALDIKGMKSTLAPAYKALYITKDYDDKEFASGFVLFDSTLGELSVQNVSEKLPKIGDNDVTWAIPSEEDERGFWLRRVNHFAKIALEGPSKDRRSESKGGRGGRGRGRGRGGGHGGDHGGGRGGGRGGVRGGWGGGRGGGRGGKSAPAGGQGGEKRKADTPETAGSSERTVPTVTATKKTKLEDGSAAAAS